MLLGYGLLIACAIGLFALIVPALDVFFGAVRPIGRGDRPYMRR
jgi:hypothetical protein